MLNNAFKCKKSLTILQQLMLNIVLPLILFIVAYSAYSYYKEQKKLSEQIQKEVTQLSSHIKTLVDVYDEGLIAHEEAISQRMGDLSQQIYDTEIKAGIPLSKIDLHQLSSDLKMDTLKESIYIIDKNGVICNTTFYKDRNLDFIKLDKEFATFFSKIYKNKKFQADRFGLEMTTRKIKKFSFQPNHNNQFIIELGFYSQKADQLHQLLLNKVQTSASSYTSFSDVKFDAAIKNVKSFMFDKKYDSLLAKTVTEKQSQQITETKDGIDYTHRFIFIGMKNSNLYDGYVLQIDTDNKLEKALLKKELITFLKLVLFIILPLVIVVIYRTRRLIKPIKQLSQKTNSISKGNLHEKVEISGSQEISELSSSFNHMIEQLRESYEGLEQKVKDRTQEIAQQKHIIEEKHKEITDSINYAERIQRSFLASDKLLKENLNEYFILFKPKDVVSGDFYWASSIQNEELKNQNSSSKSKFAFVTADSTGHGVPGAIMSLLNITSIELAIKEGNTDASAILNETRKTIINRLKKDGSEEGGKDGMDCALCIFDFANMKLQVAAANNPVWIVRKRHCEDDNLKQSHNGNEITSLPDIANTNVPEIIEIKPDKMPVGKHDKQDIPFTNHEISLQKGDIIYTLSDGFPDQFGGEKGKKFMIKNLRELILTHSHLAMHEQKQVLETTFKNWLGNIEQIDDVIIVGVKI